MFATGSGKAGRLASAIEKRRLIKTNNIKVTNTLRVNYFTCMNQLTISNLPY
ncbi:hypothetical protein PAT01_10930 [Pseudoalteromonas atlantica]|uniref:Uncharacterized protein n=1 Tax=Pseudoalteromonas atlantica TaxID=288 RepID=A0ABQ0UBB4_PSEAF|nr:hypothetical protein PAT01_10930 [Pseudoalteromonas atlantica]